VKQLNVQIEDDEYAAAKEGAKLSGMMLRRFVGKALMNARNGLAKTQPQKERTYEPVGDG
jgi:hypothetical protein